MSMDLYQEESTNRLIRMPVTDTVEPGAFEGFTRGIGMYGAQSVVKLFRGIDMLGAVGPIAQDAFTGGITAQTKYFDEHKDVFDSAMRTWTPQPNEVGMAGQIVGEMLGTIGQVVISPSLAVAGQQLGTAEDLMNQGVSSGKAQAVGAIQGAGLGFGVWLPILGTSLTSRVLAGGIGANVIQGITTRTASAAVLHGEKAAEQFDPFDLKAITLDAVLGAAFGGWAHINPTMRAQSKAAWDRLDAWAQNLDPSQKAALATLREAQHLNVDSAPGTPIAPADIEAHVNRMNAAIDQLINTGTVKIDDMPQGQYTPKVAENLMEGQYQPTSIRDRVADQLTKTGMVKEQVEANAAIWDAFFQTIGKRTGLDPNAVYERFVGEIKKGSLEDLGDLKQIAPIFHSELGRQVEAAKMEAAPAKDWKNYLKGRPGVKAEEMKWSGLDEWLDTQGGKVTKAQVQDFLRNGGVQVQEVTLSELKLDAAMKEALDYIGERAPTDNEGWISIADSFMEIAQNRQARGDRSGADKMFALSEQASARAEGVNPETGSSAGVTKFSTYQLPGGENYRELLLTLPGAAPRYDIRKTADGVWEIISDDGGVVGQNEDRGVALRIAKEMNEEPLGSDVERAKKRGFWSSHFQQPNILAHVRFNERTDADGKKVLFLEEIQSDWGQQGKKQGFREKLSPEQEKRLQELDRIPDDKLTQAERAEYEKLITMRDSPVPAGPFVGKTEAWVALALKRMIRYAAENGFDRIAWTTGEQQAARYDLSKQVGRVVWNENTKQFWAYDKNLNERVIDRANVEAKDLENLVGKEAAKKITEKEPNNIGIRQLDGEDLKVGGEGMKAFYDKIIPNVANDVLKKLGGGRVDGAEISQDSSPRSLGFFASFMEKNHPEVARPVVAEMWAQGKENQYVREFEAEQVKTAQLGFNITPEMRAKALESQPLFQQNTSGTARGYLDFAETGKMDIGLLARADASTFGHESAHMFLEITNELAAKVPALEAEMQVLFKEWGLTKQI